MSDGSPDLQTLGQVLRQAREARALALDEVEMQTRIRLKFLQALESGDLSVLPSVTHAKGFLRNYAQFLRLDANALVAEFSMLTGGGIVPVTSTTAPSYVPPPRPVDAPYPDQTGEDGPVILPTEAPPEMQPARRSTYITPRERVGPAVPRGASPPQGFTPQYPQNPASSPQQGDPRQAAPARQSRIKGLPGRILQSAFFTVAILLIGFGVIVWWAMTQLSQISVDNLIPTPDDSAIVEGLDLTSEATSTYEPTSTQSDQVIPQILDRVLLNITAEQRTWVRITVDGEVTFEGQAEPGTILQYEGQQEIIVLAGNAAALNVTYNGRPIGLLGERGEIVERFFTADGNMMTPTATVTVTTTSTSIPSPTPRGGGGGTPTPGD